MNRDIGERVVVERGKEVWKVGGMGMRERLGKRAVRRGLGWR